MKKFFAILIIVVCIFIITSCDFNAPLRNKMIEKYSEDQNYVTLTGEIVSVNENIVVIKCKELLDYISCAHETCSYYIYSDQFIDLPIGEEVQFTTVPFHFYNGHELPIVELKIDGNILLPFEEGKENLIEWVNTF